MEKIKKLSKNELNFNFKNSKPKIKDNFLNEIKLANILRKTLIPG